MYTQTPTRMQIKTWRVNYSDNAITLVTTSVHNFTCANFTVRSSVLLRMHNSRTYVRY